MSLWLFPLSALTLFASLVFGGGAARGLASDYLPQVFAIPLLFIAARQAGAASFADGESRTVPQSIAFAVLALTALALVALHLVPMPPSVWSNLPGRAPIVAAFDAAGLALPWLPLSFRPDETWRVLLALTPPVALLFATLRLDVAQRCSLLLLIVALACINVIVAMLQIVSGVQSVLYFYEFTNVGRAVGLFANANHVTALFYVAIPLAAAILANAGLKEPFPSWVLLSAVGFLLVLGLSLTGSRSALILGGIAMLSVAYVAPSGYFSSLASGKRGWIWGALVAIVTLPVALGVGLYSILARFESQDILEDARFALAPAAMRALRASFPFGSGAGSFETWFQMHETRSDIGHAIVNHAHNDWLEFVIEFGLPGLLVLGFGLGLLAIASVNAFRGGDDLGSRLAKSACLVLWLLLIHSLWDYPLRTIALASVAAVCCGVLAPAREGSTSFGPLAPLLSQRKKQRSKRREPKRVSV